MTERIDARKAANYVHLTYHGPFTIEGARRAIHASLEARERWKCARVLFDIRPMTGTMTVMDRFDTAKYGASQSSSKMRVAFVARPDQISPDNFFENVARNRGMTLSVFDDFDKAVSWLESA